MHDKVVRSEYSDIWHVLWPGFEITMNNTKKHNQVMKENTKMDRKQCTFLLVHVCVNNLSFHCPFWCNKQYFFQLSKQCVWLRAIMPLSMVFCSLRCSRPTHSGKPLIDIVHLRISAQKIRLISFRVARTYVSVSDKRVSYGFLMCLFMCLTISLILTCA